jgi:hypothetical protein
LFSAKKKGLVAVFFCIKWDCFLFLFCRILHVQCCPLHGRTRPCVGCTRHFFSDYRFCRCPKLLVQHNGLGQGRNYLIRF